MRVALLLFLLVAAAAPVDGAPCDDAELRQRLTGRGLPVQAITDDGRGGVVVFLGHDGATEALAWLGRLASGQVVSSRRVLDPGETETWEPRFQALFAAIGALPPSECPRLALPPAGRADAAELLDGLREALAPPAGPTASAPVWASPRVVTWLALLEVLALVTLLVVQGVRSARTNPRQAVELAALVVGAVAVRALLTTRHPIGAANGDFTHVLHAATWLSGGFGADLGAAYPPAYRVLLMAVYAVTGPSVAVGCWLTTLVGALTAVPAALLARRLGGPSGALLAGLALATYPAAVFFSNGIDLSMPAAFLLTLSFERVLAAVERPGVLPVATWALALLLFAECRLEAAGLALPVAAAQLAMLAEVRSRGLWRRFVPAATIALVLALPYAGFLRDHAADLGKGGDALPLLAAGSGALALVTTLWFLADRGLARAPWSALGMPLLLSLGAYLLVAQVVERASGNAFLPSPQVVPEFPFVRYYVEQGPQRYVDHAGLRFFLLEPGMFPLALLIPWAMSLLPRLEAGRRRLPVAPLLLLGLPLVAWLATSRSHTGVVLAEGLRLHAVFSGLMAVSLGVGAARVLDWVGPGASRWAAGAVLAAVVLAPLGTHRGLPADGERSPQAEARFVEEAVSRLPDGATVLLPDDAVDMSEEQLGVRRVHEVFRTDHLWQALAAAGRKRLTVVPLSTFLALPLPADGPIVAALGLDCARARRPETLNPSCRWLRRVVKAPPLQDVEIPNQTYESLGIPWFQPSTPTLTLSLLPIAPAEVADLRRDAPSQLVKAPPGQVY